VRADGPVPVSELPDDFGACMPLLPLVTAVFAVNLLEDLICLLDDGARERKPADSTLWEPDAWFDRGVRPLELAAVLGFRSAFAGAPALGTVGLDLPALGKENKNAPAKTRALPSQCITAQQRNTHIHSFERVFMQMANEERRMLTGKRVVKIKHGQDERHKLSDSDHESRGQRADACCFAYMHNGQRQVRAA